MEEEVETWDSALLNCPIPRATAHRDRDTHFINQFLIVPGMFLS